MKRKQYEWVARWHDAAWDNALCHIAKMTADNPNLKDFERTGEGTLAIRALHEVIDMAANLVFQIAGGLPMLCAEIDLPDVPEVLNLDLAEAEEEHPSCLSGVSATSE